MGTWILNNRDPLVFRLYILFSWCRFWWWKVGHGAPHAGGHVHCRGRFLGTIGQDPSVSKSTWLHVDIIQFFFINSSYILYLGCFLKVLNFNQLFLKFNGTSGKPSKKNPQSWFFWPPWSAVSKWLQICCFGLPAEILRKNRNGKMTWFFFTMFSTSASSSSFCIP